MVGGIYTVNVNMGNFVTAEVEMTSSVCTFMVDSGADISIFKRKNIKYYQWFYPNGACSIKGIMDGCTKSLGTTSTTLKFNADLSISHTFHIVDNEFPIPTDAILGRDFLTNFKCSLDYDTWLLTINTPEGPVEVPIKDRVDDSSIIVPSRCKVVRHLSGIEITCDSVMEKHEISPGVLIAEAIISKKCPFIKILNTTEKTVIIKTGDISPNLTPLSELSIHKMDKVKNFQLSNERIKLLKSIIDKQKIPGYVGKDLEELCVKYADIFALEGDNLETNNFYNQTIELSDNVPVYIKNYRSPESQRDEINIQVNKMLDDGIIEPSVSHFNSPILLVQKKSSTDKKKWRLVVDFRQLNKKLLADKFPLPRIDEILDQLGRAKYFSTLDLMSGFHQIGLEKNSRKYTAFSTTKGHYQFTRLPFGLNLLYKSSGTIRSKLSSVRQNGKSINAYAKEIKDLSKSLKRAHIREGNSSETAEIHAVEAATESILNHTNNIHTK